jgi:hypothetical protein
VDTRDCGSLRDGREIGDRQRMVREQRHQTDPRRVAEQVQAHRAEWPAKLIRLILMSR